MPNMNAADWIFYVLFWINNVFVIIVSISFIPQFLFYLFFFLKRRHWKPAKKTHHIAVIIAAHNEESVIGETVKHLLTEMNYPKDYYRVYVCAHNCSDKTAEVARAAGATVFELHDPDKKHGMVAYPLKYMVQQILKTDEVSELFVRFDADNIPHPDYLKHMNDTFDAGAHCIRGYEAATNLKQNLWTEECAIFYTKDSRVQNTFRQALKSTAMTPGPGMAFDREVAQRMNGWDCMTAAEDAQFCWRRLFEGYKVYFNTDAIVYEDQPATFADTYNRLVRLGHSLNKLFFTDGWRMIVMFFRTLNPMYLDMLLQVMFNPVSVICFLWFPIYYIAYGICMLCQIGGVHIFNGYFDAVGISIHHHDTYGIHCWYMSQSAFDAMSRFDQLSFLGNAAVYDLLIMAVEVILTLLLFCIFQSWIALFLDRRKLGMDYRLKGMWKGILLSPIFSFVYGLCNVIGAVSHPKWKIAKRNPKETNILYPLPERKKKIWYINISEREKRRYNGTKWMKKKKA